MIDWLHPSGHLAWIAVAIAAAVLWFGFARRRRLAEAFGDLAILERLGVRMDQRAAFVHGSIIVAALGLFSLALAGPRIGTDPREVELTGLDLVVALDVSRSMLAEDVAPSRLERAREEVNRLTRRLGDDRVGLIAFAGEAYQQMPLSHDRNALRMYLEAASPDIIPTQGTNFSSMLRVAREAFEGGGNADDHTRVLLIVSDGEDQEAGYESHLRRLREAGVHVVTLGIGTEDGAEIPIEQDGQTIYHRDRAGNVVTTQLERALLQDLATDGAYFEITRTTSGAERLAAHLAQLERSAIGTVVYGNFAERYQWPLAVGVILLLAEVIFRDRRRAQKQAAGA
jgi:Ca-activated chloride channel homolog